MGKFGTHHLRIQAHDTKLADAAHIADHAEAIRSWLTALAGAEHLSLLIGSGLGIAVAGSLGAEGLDMSTVTMQTDGASEVDVHAAKLAKACGRGEANIEDQLRSALALLAGLEVIEPDAARTLAWRKELNTILADFAKRGLNAEQAIREKVVAAGADDPAVEQMLVGFLLGFASRPPSRERLNVFTTNYDRLIEFGCDRGGLRVLDRFVGSIEPAFRASRLDVDLHYNPPGIRGEPRYLEGVMRLCKLHGSLDWRIDEGRLRRVPLEFGGNDPGLEDAGSNKALERLIIYPNAAKDVETLQFPYAELFRDFSAALCRPNNVLVTFGYGFGDDHVNRIILDMLTLRSTHLLVISYDDPGQRIESFLSNIAVEQSSVLIGPHLGDLRALVENYLPQAGAEQFLLRQARRDRELENKAPTAQNEEDMPTPAETVEEGEPPTGPDGS
ncbi:MAG: SIR2 family protein [Actinobacteria bacterium]|nr:SIR2 family protein [Actinomycetota bacterium]